MSNHTNPFRTLEDVVATLESLGANPLGASLMPHWTSKVLSITTEKKYSVLPDSPYFATCIHLTKEGFEAFLRTVAFEGVSSSEAFVREPLETLKTMDRLKINIGSTLEIFTLVGKEEDVLCDYGTQS